MDVKTTDMRDKEKIFTVYWEGPFTSNQIKELKNRDENLASLRRKFWVLYSAYGSHQLYGQNVLLYIGKTIRGPEIRLSEHDAWFDDQKFGETKYFLASICDFESWDDEGDMHNKSHTHDETGCFYSRERSGDEVIERVEALLIKALTPVKNSSGKVSSKKSLNDIRVFNTGNIAALPHEVSGKYWDF